MPVNEQPSGVDEMERPLMVGWILSVVATVGELSICRVSLCVRIIVIGELYLAG
jgi:hypothetical protein